MSVICPFVCLFCVSPAKEMLHNMDSEAHRACRRTRERIETKLKKEKLKAEVVVQCTESAPSPISQISSQSPKIATRNKTLSSPVAVPHDPLARLVQEIEATRIGLELALENLSDVPIGTGTVDNEFGSGAISPTACRTYATPLRLHAEELLTQAEANQEQRELEISQARQNALRKRRLAQRSLSSRQNDIAKSLNQTEALLNRVVQRITQKSNDALSTHWLGNAASEVMETGELLREANKRLSECKARQQHRLTVRPLEMSSSSVLAASGGSRNESGETGELCAMQGHALKTVPMVDDDAMWWPVCTDGKLNGQPSTTALRDWASRGGAPPSDCVTHKRGAACSCAACARPV